MALSRRNGGKGVRTHLVRSDVRTPNTREEVCADCEITASATSMRLAFSLALGDKCGPNGLRQSGIFIRPIPVFRAGYAHFDRIAFTNQTPCEREGSSLSGQ